MKASVLLCALFFVAARAGLDFRVGYSWFHMDLQYATKHLRRIAIWTKYYIPENLIPTSIDIHKNKLFVALPRMRPGVHVSLGYIDLDQNPPYGHPDGLAWSPKLWAYPNWPSHLPNLLLGRPEIVSPFSLKVDTCHRLWVLDSGWDHFLQVNPSMWGRPTLFIFELYNDRVMRKFEIPKNQWIDTSWFVNLAVEENNCKDSFGYFADCRGAALVVYSYREDKSWVVQHEYFKPDPLAVAISVGGVDARLNEGIHGLALGVSTEDGYSTLYFHPLSSFDEFSVSTKILRNRTLVSDPIPEDVKAQFKKLGSRGPQSQSAGSVIHKESQTLYYTLVQLNSIGSWKNNTPYAPENQVTVYSHNKSMVYPYDIKIDNSGNLWVLSNKMPIYSQAPSKIEAASVNYRIWVAKVGKGEEDGISRNMFCTTLLFFGVTCSLFV